MIRKIFVLTIVALGLGLPSADAANCKDVLARYKAKLDSSKLENLRYRSITFGYLKSLEAAFADCFKQKEGADLKAARLKLAKEKPPAIRKKLTKEEKSAKKVIVGRRRTSSSSNDAAANAVSWTPRRKRLHPASAAFFSFVIPGAGQALKNQPIPAFLFFIGVSGCYAIAAGVASAGISVKSGGGGTFFKKENVAGSAIIAVAGGLIHIGAVLHAGLARED